MLFCVHLCLSSSPYLSVYTQLFWERRLKGLRSSDVTEEVLRTMELPKGLQSKQISLYNLIVMYRYNLFG